MSILRTEKVIVFDLDGVLINSEAANYQAFAYSIEALGLPCPDRQTVISLVGLKATSIMARGTGGNWQKRGLTKIPPKVRPLGGI